MIRKCGFGPVADADARVLILGSLPGQESLARGQYYAHKRNGFWTIMGALVGADPDLGYEERLDRLKRSKIALWDVCASATRPGSLDANITAPEPNDFAAFFAAHPGIERICFNGRPAEALFDRLVKSPGHMDRIRLPSTSPAHAAMGIDAKLAVWRAALAPFIIPDAASEPG